MEENIPLNSDTNGGNKPRVSENNEDKTKTAAAALRRVPPFRDYYNTSLSTKFSSGAGASHKKGSKESGSNREGSWPASNGDSKSYPTARLFYDLLEPMSPRSSNWKNQDISVLRRGVLPQVPRTPADRDVIVVGERKVSKSKGPIPIASPMKIVNDRKMTPYNTSSSDYIPKTPSRPYSRFYNNDTVAIPSSSSRHQIFYNNEDSEHMSSTDVTDSLKDLISSRSLRSQKKSLEYKIEDSKASESESVVDGLKVKLLKHQVEGLKFLLGREDESITNKGGLLCDDMGLGKTIQSIALIISHPFEQKMHSSSNACKSTLVVAPLALIQQWSKELQDKAQRLSVLVHHGQSRTKQTEELKKFDVVITTYQLVASEYNNNGPLFKLDWWRIILDEGHTIKNKNSQSSIATRSLHARQRWILTGTPLQNNIDELHSLFLFLHIPPLCESAFWKEKISQPISKGRGKLAMKRLQVVLAEVLLRRTKDVLGASQIKLPKRHVHRSVIELTEPERIFYDSLENKMATRMQNLLGEGGQKYMSVLLLLLRLRQACNHTSIVATSMVQEKEHAMTLPPVESKSIVKDEVDDLAELMEGMTVDIKSCVVCQTELPKDSSSSKYCEFCKKEFVSRGISKVVPSAKISKLLSLLKADPGRKTIVFSQFTSMLDIIEPFLRSNSIIFTRYDGSMKPQERVDSLEKLSSDHNVTVLLCSLKCGALGLNLVSASRVILVDPWWNPMISEQAIDRVHRIGQTQDVDVYEFIVDRSVEERIMKLQEQKRELAKGVMDDKKGKLNVNRLTRDEILYLFNRTVET
ncbi:SNF2 family N-terminal domain-containing protein [Dipodascopsis uninucleata]